MLAANSCLKLILLFFHRFQRASRLICSRHHIANWETCTAYYNGSIMARMFARHLSTIRGLLFVPAVKW